MQNLQQKEQFIIKEIQKIKESFVSIQKELAEIEGGEKQCLTEFITTETKIADMK
jgi:hypothetical protein